VHTRVAMSSRIFQELPTADLSRGGVAVEMPQPLPVNSAILVAFTGTDVRVNATVKHCTKRPEGFVVGAAFGALTEAQRQAIERMLAQSIH
jgi:PilZ domain-containing protein